MKNLTFDIKHLPSKIVWFNRTNIYYFGLALMLIALPLSKYLMSVAQFVLVFNWLFDRNVIGKFRRFFHNKPALILSSLFLIHVIGLLWTSDFNYAMKDLRIKLPILALPVIISTSPRINKKLFFYFMLLFIAANVVGSFFSIHALLSREIIEIRKISLFMSHIRFSLNICIAIFAGGYLLVKAEKIPVIVRILTGLAIVWLFIFLVIMESITGLAAIFITLTALILILVIKRKNKLIKFVLFSIIIIIPVVLFFYLKSVYKETLPKEIVVFEKLEKYSPLGNSYVHDTADKMLENGYRVGLYLQEDELREAWNARSELKYDGKDRKEQHIKYTLIRFLTSKGLRKDKAGVDALNNEEVETVENGIANVEHQRKTNLKTRIKIIIWEYQVYKNTGYLSGHSVMQRIEFWRASMRIISDNFWFGTGTGDIKNAFKDEYKKMSSSLNPKFRWRSHNQFLSVFAALGIFGLLWFVAVLIIPGIMTGGFKDYFYLIFFIILTLSMLSEDTIENQAGVTFYAFLTSFFLFARKDIEQF